MNAPLPFGSLDAAVRELVRRSRETVKYAMNQCGYCIGSWSAVMPRSALMQFQHDEDCPWWALIEWVRTNPDEASTPPRAEQLAYVAKGVIDHDRTCVECQAGLFCDSGLRLRGHVVDTLGGIR